jgi:hypothetical protein
MPILINLQIDPALGSEKFEIIFDSRRFYNNSMIILIVIIVPLINVLSMLALLPIASIYVRLGVIYVFTVLFAGLMMVFTRSIIKIYGATAA